MTDATEVWLPVVGYESTYAVSSLGRVRSVRANRDLKQASSGRGYRTVTLCVDSRPATRYVHHLVAAAFHGERPSGHPRAKTRRPGRQKHHVASFIPDPTPAVEHATDGACGNTDLIG